MTALLVKGIQESANFNSVVVMVKIAVVVLFILAGVGYVNTHYLGVGCEAGVGDCLQFIPPNTGTFGQYGYSGILTGAAVIFLPISVSMPSRPPPRKRKTRSGTCRGR